MAQPINKARPTDATIRALKRVEDGERPTHAATAEGINTSTLFRALSKKRPRKLFVVITINSDVFTAWIEDQNYRRQGASTAFSTPEEMQTTLSKLLAQCCTVANTFASNGATDSQSIDRLKNNQKEL
jgi:hypothetical protein